MDVKSFSNFLLGIALAIFFHAVCHAGVSSIPTNDGRTIHIWDGEGTISFSAGDLITYQKKVYVATSFATNTSAKPDQDSSLYSGGEPPSIPVPDFDTAAIDVETFMASYPGDSQTPDFNSSGLVSLSIRGEVGTGDNLRIMSFILSGSDNVLMRGLGPVLEEYDLPPQGSTLSLLPDPEIRLFKYDSSAATSVQNGSVTSIVSGDNDNYSGTQSSINSAINSLVPNVKLTTLQAVSYPSLSSAFYTLHLQDTKNRSGIGTAAVDLVSSASAKFTHLSSRGLVSKQEIMFGSFQITGSSSRKIFIRGRGPSLSQYNVPNVMPETKIELYKYVNDPNDDQENPSEKAPIIATNVGFENNTTTSDNVRELSTSLYGWPVMESLESGILIDLEPGYYSAQLHPVSPSSETESKNGWIGIDDVTDYEF